MSNLPNQTKLLIEKMVAGTITESEIAVLEEILANDQLARREYLKQLQFESSMHFYADSIQEPENAPIFPDVLTSRRHPIAADWHASQWFAIFATAALLAIGVIASLRFSDNGNTTPVALKVVTSLGTDRHWNEGDALTGPVEFSSGILNVQTLEGSLISLEGPCKFKMTGPHTGQLERGKLVAFCGEDTDKITIKTSSGTYTDLGTEFGVSVENEQSSLHVFDGQVYASKVSGHRAQVVEGASSIQSVSAGHEGKKRLVDFAGFGRLRHSLSQEVVVENFSNNLVRLDCGTSFRQWQMNCYLMSDDAEANVDEMRSLGSELGKYLLVEGITGEFDDGESAAFLETQWDYAKDQPIDVTKAHTIECLVRFNGPTSEILDFQIYGSEKSTWNKRSWSVGAAQVNGQLMWNVYNSPKAVGSNKFQQLAIRQGTPFHVLVEIDPQIGRFRTTVSDGQQRIWNELYDGSAVALRNDPLGKLFWRIRGKSNKQLSFSIDSIQVRNRPVLDQDTIDHIQE